MNTAGDDGGLPRSAFSDVAKLPGGAGEREGMHLQKKELGGVRTSADSVSRKPQFHRDRNRLLACANPVLRASRCWRLLRQAIRFPTHLRRSAALHLLRGLPKVGANRPGEPCIFRLGRTPRLLHRWHRIRDNRSFLRSKNPGPRMGPLMGFSQWGNLCSVATANRLHREVIGVR